MSYPHSHDPTHEGHALSEDGVCNIDVLNLQLNSIFKDRLSNIGTTEISQDAFQAFQDLLPEALAASVETGQPPASEAATPEAPAANSSTTNGQLAFDDAGFQPTEPGSTFNQGNFHLVGYEASEPPPMTSTGFVASDSVSSGFGDLPPPQNFGEADPEDLKLPPPDPNETTNHGFQPPKWAEILLPVTTDLKSNLPQNYRIPIKIGDIEFEPMLDTGSSLLWVPAKLQADDKVPEGVPFYKPAVAPKRGKRIPLQTITYGAGSIKYRPWTDTVSVKAADSIVSSPMFPFGGAVNLDADSEVPYGILGLSPQTPVVWKDGAVVNKSFNLIWALERMGEIKAPVASFIGPNIHSGPAADLDPHDNKQNRGFLAIGRLREDFYTGELAWCKLLTPDKWIVALEEVCINGKPLPDRPRRALIDTGMSYIAATSDDFDDIVGRLPKATLATGGNFFYAPDGVLETVTFKLGGRVLGLRPEDLHIGKSSTETGNVVGSIVRKPDQYGGSDSEYWVLGGIFLDNVVTSFLFGDEYCASKIGFADVAQRDFANWKPDTSDPFKP